MQTNAWWRWWTLLWNSELVGCRQTTTSPAKLGGWAITRMCLIQKTERGKAEFEEVRQLRLDKIHNTDQLWEKGNKANEKKRKKNNEKRNRDIKAASTATTTRTAWATLKSTERRKNSPRGVSVVATENLLLLFCNDSNDEAGSNGNNRPMVVIKTV